MIFADVKTLTIPEGEVTKITVGSTVLWQEVSEYTVTQYLSECTSNNSATKVNGGSSFTATLSADTSMYLYDAYVSVRMGGRDITSSACSFSSDNKTVAISISNITGNIVISAEATERNYIVESTDENGDIFNDYGFTDNEEYNGDSYYATGFMPIARNNDVCFYDMEVCVGDKLVFYNSSYTEIAVLTVNFDDSRFSGDGDYASSYIHNGVKYDNITNASVLTNSKYFRVFCQYIDEYSRISID